MPVVGEQIAALPLRWSDKDRLQVLMVTSRDTGRWVMPKGWQMDGKQPWTAAEIEALQEAGAVGHVGRQPIGSFSYAKILSNGCIVPCTVRVYPMLVETLRRDWKERKQRKRRWFSMKGAARCVVEEDLAQLLLDLDHKQRSRTLWRDLKKRRV